jgi:hypothetical protein
MNNLKDFGLALKFHTKANKSITVAEFQRAVRISSGFELEDHIVDVIFNVFDENGDGQLSYTEFIAVLKDRLRRGLKPSGRNILELKSNSIDLFDNAHHNSQSDVLVINDEIPGFFARFKRCIRRKMHGRVYD